MKTRKFTIIAICIIKNCSQVSIIYTVSQHMCVCKCKLFFHNRLRDDVEIKTHETCFSLLSKKFFDFFAFFSKKTLILSLCLSARPSACLSIRPCVNFLANHETREPKFSASLRLYLCRKKNQVWFVSDNASVIQL